MKNIKISTLVVVTTLILVVFGSGIAIYSGFTKDDPLVELMDTLNEQTGKCKEELKTFQSPGDECAFMLEVGDRIFDGNAEVWGRDMIRLGHLTMNNIEYVNKSLRDYVDTMKVVAALLRHQANSLTHKSEMDI